MKGHAPELVSLDILFTDPEFRIKKATNLPLSRRGERVKKTIRSKYKQRVPNYFFDIIMHIGDNVYQSRYMQQVLEPQISFSEVLDILENYIYVLAKVNTPYMPDSFPDDIPVGKDVDVLCNKENIEDISNKLESHFITSTDYEVERKRNNHGIQVRISCCKKLIFLIDLAWSVEGLKKTFVEAALGERVMKGSYYELSPRHEYIYRLISFHEDKSKLHHREYLEKNKGNFDREELTRYYCSNIDRLLY